MNELEGVKGAGIVYLVLVGSDLTDTELSKFDSGLHSEESSNESKPNLSIDSKSYVSELRNKVRQISLNLETSLVNFGKGSKTKLKQPQGHKEAVQSLMKEHKMIIVSGPAQSGKSELISKISKESARTCIRIYITEQLDTKSLLGNYICTERVGEFEWRDGIFSSVMRSGGYLILENLQEASDELLELVYDALGNRMKVRGESLSLKDSFRILASYTLSNEQAARKLADVKRQTFEIADYPLAELTFDDMIPMYPSLMSNLLIKEILKSLYKLSCQYSKEGKSELKSTLIDAKRLLIRFNALFCSSFTHENPIHFAANFKLMLVHIFHDIYLSKFRSPVPPALHQQLADIFKLTLNEVTVYLMNYKGEIKIGPTWIRCKRYGSMLKSLPLQLADQLDLRITEAKQFKPVSDSSNVPLEFFGSSLVANLVEGLIGCAQYGDNMLLVGEAGCGKTTIVQQTAKVAGKTLHVYNLSQSSDVSDLVGGYKPLNAATYIAELSHEFVRLIRKHFDYAKNVKLVSYLRQIVENGKPLTALMYMLRESRVIVDGCVQRIELAKTAGKEKEQTLLEKKLRSMKKLNLRLENTYQIRERLESSLIFKFISGNLVNSLKEGDWILLDEINLAQPEILQNILPILEKESIILVEKGEIKEIKRHPEFRIFGCMNPGNTAGKKELPWIVRKNFVEYFVSEMEDVAEIEGVIRSKSRCQLEEKDNLKLAQLYLRLRNLAKTHLIVDGFNRKPTISLRALSRAIEIALKSQSLYTNKQRSLLEGIYSSFSSNLSLESKTQFDNLVKEIFSVSDEFLQKCQEQAKNASKEGYVNVEGFLLKKGSVKVELHTESSKFMLTGSVKRNLIELLRVVCHSNYPILLEGPTSSGKTSMIKFLGEASGNKVVRINNHHHTDLDEYIGSYSPDNTGRLVFKEGLLVEAMRKGYWIILDELNLAKSEILEALNRLLDDNRELYVPEINETIVPHEHFRIFATQNPLDYGGRKELSIAFRSRFFHFYFRDIENEDLVKIIESRCKVPESRSKVLIEIMKGLRNLRSRQNIFSGKESLITIRDLIKWGSREVVDFQQLAINGYCLLGERLRFETEREQVLKVITERTTKNTHILDIPAIYRNYFETSKGTHAISEAVSQTVFWSQSFIRMYSLVMMALEQHEPVLLIGETGSGKTTIAELLAKIFKVELFTVNCHQYTESSDFLGGLRPVRNKEAALVRVQQLIEEVMKREDIDEEQREQLRNLKGSIESDGRLINLELCTVTWKRKGMSCAELESIKAELERLDQQFEWVDGPLVQCMRNGGVLLIDEISLAEDSVLERLNSVLESEKTLVVSEKGDGSVQEMQAHPNFMIIATMNPSGDYGKKELTPALRNRFTEVWVEPVTAVAALKADTPPGSTVLSNLFQTLSGLKNDFINLLLTETKNLEEKHFEGTQTNQRALLTLVLHRIVLTFNDSFASFLKPLTVRDVKSTLIFFYRNLASYDELDYFVILDYIHILLGGFKCINKEISSTAIKTISEEVLIILNMHGKNGMSQEAMADRFIETDEEIRISRYNLQKHIKGNVFESPLYSLEDRTIVHNMKQILIALSLNKSLMLEGPPGVGKTSLISYLAKKSGIPFFRVNLNEQTDMIDLLGSDVPSDNSALFKWADGVLIQAMKQGAWILLDEMNMASQTVLEGMNSILDHRGAIYIPELDATVNKHPNFRIFASQNPMQMGSGRKGLPHSFISRFTRVWIEEIGTDSLRTLIQRIYPETQTSNELALLIDMFFKTKEWLRTEKGKDTWEFNLRDLHKMMEIYSLRAHQTPIVRVNRAIKVCIMDRLDDEESRKKMKRIYNSVFNTVYREDLEREIGEASEEVLPEYLNTANIRRISNVVDENLRSTLEIIVESKEPCLCLFDSSDQNSIIQPANVVKTLGLMKNRKVKEISLFASSDVIDIIGSFEQIDPTERLNQEALKTLRAYINDQQLALDPATLKKLTGLGYFSLDANVTQIIHRITQQMKNTELGFKNESSTKLIEKLEKLASESTMNLFSWEESELAKCIRNGDWVILKGCELVNPAILERLNGLLEDTEININEAIGADESAQKIVKHKMFRIFIMYDLGKTNLIPSRALRNRCIELNIANYEWSTAGVRPIENEQRHIEGLLESVVGDQGKSIVEAIEASVKIEKRVFTLAMFWKHYKQFLDKVPLAKDLGTLNSLFEQVRSKVAQRVNYRANFRFTPRVEMDMRTMQTQHNYSPKALIDGELRSLLSNFLENYFMVFSEPSKMIGVSAQQVREAWKRESGTILESSSREEITEWLESISCQEWQRQQSALLVAASLDPRSKHFPKFLLALVQLLEHPPQELSTATDTPGFITPVNLCLNLVFNLLIVGSSKVTRVIDHQESHLNKNSAVWPYIAKLFSKAFTLKMKIISKVFSMEELIAKIKQVVKVTLSTDHKTIDDALFLKLLALIIETIESSYKSIEEKFDTLFVNYEVLNEANNITEQKIAFRSEESKIEAFIGFLSKTKYLEELGGGDKYIKVGQLIDENFVETREVLACADKIRTMGEGLKGDKLREYLSQLCSFYRASPEQAGAVFELLEEMEALKLYRLAKLVGDLNFAEFKLSDVDSLEFIRKELEAALPSFKINRAQGTDLAMAADEMQEALKRLDEICKYANNPNQNSFDSLFHKIETIIQSEHEILENRSTSLQKRCFKSVATKLGSVSQLKEGLSDLGRLLRSQKMRRISNFQFSEINTVAGNDDNSISFFAVKTAMKMLVRNSSFLSEADVHEMNRINGYIIGIAKKQTCHIDFDELLVYISDLGTFLSEFIKNGNMIIFGDFLIEFFAITSKILLSIKKSVVEYLGDKIIKLEDISKLRVSLQEALSETYKDHPNHVLVESVGCFFGLQPVLDKLQQNSEGTILIEKQQLNQEESLIRGRTFDEASAMRNLKRGIERAVKDEYTQETVREHREEEKFEIQKIFGLEEAIKDDPKYKLVQRQKHLHELRLDYMTKVLQHIFISSEMLPMPAHRAINSHALLSTLYFLGPNQLDLENRQEIVSSFGKNLVESLKEAVKGKSMKDVRRTIMLEQKSTPNSIAIFRRMWEEQMQEFIELEQTNFYKGQCVQELVQLRGLLYKLLDRIQDTRKNVELRDLPVINNITALVDRLLVAKVARTNLNEVCSVIEKLHQYIIDYESVTPKIYHFQTEKDLLRDSLLEYRKKERKSWRGMVFSQSLGLILADMEECIEIKRALEEEILAEGADEDMRFRKLMDAVDGFMLKTMFIRTLFRVYWLIQLTESLRPLLERRNKMKIFYMVSHLIRVHINFVDSCFFIYQQNFEQVAAPIKDNEKLSNWHMKDIVNIKM
jgi:MoxR-like ATPase